MAESDSTRLESSRMRAWQLSMSAGKSSVCEVVPVFRARPGLRMNGLGDLQDERKEHEADIECTTAVYGRIQGEAVQMLLDGHSAPSVVERLGLSGANLLYRWKRDQLEESGPVASALDARVVQLEAELRRVERERDILKKALAIFSRSE